MASYTGSGGIRMSFGPAAWEAAANGLRVLIEAAHPEGTFDVLCRDLRATQPDRPLDCTRGTATIRLHQVGSAIARPGQRDLFGGVLNG